MKKHERRSPFHARCALWIALGCAVFAPLGCGGDDSTTGSPAGTGGGGAGGSGGSGGTAGSGGTSGDTDASGGAMCGGFASLQCPEPMVTFCDYDDKQACGQTDATGVCTLRPAACTDDCPGVCGCNGKFYCNACQANRDGTDIQPMGTCSDAGN